MMSSSILLSIIITVLIMTICCQSKNNNVTFDCVPSEKKALLMFKASFSDDPSNMLSSWKADSDCCSWARVECDKATRHVVKLDLRNRVVYEYGYFYPSPDSNVRLRSDTIDSSLLELKYLSHLDLSGNDFNGSSIPTFLGSMKQLQYLNLSYGEFNGIVPHQLGNLSSLRTLGLGGVFYYSGGAHGVRVNDITWVGNLSSLEYLGMSGVYLGRTKNVVKVLNMLPSLVDLRLSGSHTNLPYTNCVNSTPLFTNVQHLDLSSNWFIENPSFCFLCNMTSLSFLDLSDSSLGKKADWIYDILRDKCHLKSLHMKYNDFYGDISGAFKNLSGCSGRNLEIIDFSNNQFDGHFPGESFGNLRALRELNLAMNQLSNLSGEIQISLGQLSNLQKIDISNNQLSGPIPSSLGNLRALRSLHLSVNQLGGEIPVSMGQLSNLEWIDISSNSLEGTLSDAHFANLSRLEYINIGFNNGIKFTVGDDWVPPFHQLKYLWMYSVEINGRFPKWLQTQKSLVEFELSNCSIWGTLPAWLGSMKNLNASYLSNNHIEGPIPDTLPSSLIYLDLSDNMISNHLPSNIAHMMPLLQYLNLATNFINGSVPDSLCQMKDLSYLDLSRNHISGQLPDCNWGDLDIAKLSSNQLSGAIPNSIGGGDSCTLRLLQLSNNSFTGQIPFTLNNCTRLLVLDLGDNKLSGKLPGWIGNHLLELGVIRLRNNKLDGDIPPVYCQLSRLQIMDLAHNQLTGYIPHCFGNLSGMINARGFINGSTGEFSLSEVMKGVLMEYTGISSQELNNFDLSSNRLFGDIPSKLTKLTGLNGLNLSHNHLRGTIPRSIGDMNSLESFDLSSNRLSGTIPGSLSKLTYLSHLNLSNNNLSGPIPTGPQLQTLKDPSIYEGNPRLCGDPLPKKCLITNNEIPQKTRKVENDNGDMINDKIYLYAFIIGGVANGFWGYFGVLYLKKIWRQALFRRMDVLIAKMLGRY